MIDFSKQNKIPVSYKISPATFQKLEIIKQKLGVNKTRFVEVAVEKLFDKVSKESELFN